jgi:type II secretory pathway pseudopilin PulG
MNSSWIYGGEAVRLRSRRQKGLTILDSIITLCLIGILIGYVIPKYQQVAYAAQEAALKAELSNIRQSITLFKMLNGRNPESLKEMMEKKVMIPVRIGSAPATGSIFDERYLMKNALDAEGRKLDAFGNPFYYDSYRGEVRSTTKGYEVW